MATLGERIRTLRLERGLSQRQLAGTQMTRAFISMLESGRANASEPTLRLLAQRLGSTVPFLLGEANKPNEVDEREAQALLDAADALFRQQRSDLALPILRTALKLVQSPLLEGAIYSLIALSLYRLGQFDEALSAFQATAERQQRAGAVAELAWTYLYWGHAALRAQEFLTARTAFEQAIALSGDRKSMVDLCAEAHCFLGATLTRLGALTEAVAQTRFAYQLQREQGNLATAGELATQIGGCCFELGDYDEAATWARVALQDGSSDSLAALRGRHLLANVTVATAGDLEQARAAYAECLPAYEARCSPILLAEILEDMAILERRAGNLEAAAVRIKEALAQLDAEENEVLRGRLYRELGLTAGATGDRDQSYHYLSMSYVLLRRLKASQEAERSRLALQALGGGSGESQP